MEDKHVEFFHQDLLPTDNVKLIVENISNIYNSTNGWEVGAYKVIFKENGERVLEVPLIRNSIEIKTSKTR